MNKALLVIDFINDIAHPDGRIAASAAHVLEQDAIGHANQALAHARTHGWLVVLIKVGFDGGYQLQPKGSPMFGRAHQLGALTSWVRSPWLTAAPTFTRIWMCNPTIWCWPSPE